MHVVRTEIEGDIVKGFVGEAFECFLFNDEHLLAVKLFDTDAIGGDKAVGGVVAVVLDGRGVGVFAHG